MSIAPIRVLCVDDHPIVRDGVAALIGEQPDMVLVDVAQTGADAIARCQALSPDVVLMDLRLPDISGIDAIRAIRHQNAAARIIVLSSSEGDVDIRRALATGAQGYLIKATVRGALVQAIRAVHAGERYLSPEIAAKVATHLADALLSPRETEILRLVAEGRKNKQIAGDLGITEETVKMHVKNILEKLDANDRTQAVTLAFRRGILHL